jgi:Rps23 Pro-64 3,4-dihydroxylase Tpa1-like proline 4-hydroxylase
MWYFISLPTIVIKSTPINEELSTVTSKIYKFLMEVYLNFYGELDYVKKLAKSYDNSKWVQQTFRLQVYETGCHIENHRDSGYASGQHCTMLIYLSEDWKEDFGGDLEYSIKDTGEDSMSVDTSDKFIADPILGNMVVLDFTKHDPQHKVNEIKEDNYFRNVIGIWWPPSSYQSLK